MEKTFKGILLVASLLGLTACASHKDQFAYPYHDTTMHGDVVGGIVQSGGGHRRGGVDKSTLTGGTLLTGILNSDVGKAMDRQDQMNMQQAVMNTPLDQEAQWTNKRRHADYEVVPLREYHDTSGQYCREYEAIVKRDGQSKKAYGKACRNHSGKWNMK